MESTTLFVCFVYHTWNLQLFFCVFSIIHGIYNSFFCVFSITHGIYNSFFVFCLSYMESTTLFLCFFYHTWNLQLFLCFFYHTWNLQLFFVVVAVVGGVGGRLSGGFVPTEKLTRKKKKSHLLSMKGQMSFVLHDPPLHPVSSSL